jgi:hypothetical protein
MKRNSWILVLLLCAVCGAHEIPDAVVPDGVGVNIHFVSGHEKELDLIAAAGFRFIRMDFGWGGIETTKGQYNWAQYEQLLANLDRRGMRAVLILDYSNPLYEQEVTSTNPLTHLQHRTTASPQHPESIDAFSAWAAEAARHFQGRHVLWELWNEPNIDFWSPKPDAQQYTALALAAARSIRRADPQATIIGPASSGFPWEFLEVFLKSGILEDLDAVSVHPYREPRRGPETASADYRRLRDLIDRYAPVSKRQRIPILSGEWGYSSWQRGVSVEIQAAFAARQQLANLLEGVPLSIWYDWKNDGNDPNENEHNFGTMTPELKPKPAYTAIQTLTHQLEGYRISRRLPLDNGKDYVLVCTNSAKSLKLAAWTLGEPHVVPINLAGDTSAVFGVSSDGGSFAPKLTTNTCELELTDAPKYVSIGRAELK